MTTTLNQETTLIRSTERTFAVNLLAGNIGKAVIETYFCHFGYDIYHFGYENHYANITRYLKRTSSNDTENKLRAMPDLLIYDRDQQATYLVEAKTTSSVNEEEYWIEKNRFNDYKEKWPETILAVYFTSLNKVYCCNILNTRVVREGTLPGRKESGYYLDLEVFSELPEYFPTMQEESPDGLSYGQLSDEIGLILDTFGNAHARQLMLDCTSRA